MLFLIFNFISFKHIIKLNSDTVSVEKLTYVYFVLSEDNIFRNNFLDKTDQISYLIIMLLKSIFQSLLR